MSWGSRWAALTAVLLLSACSSGGSGGVSAVNTSTTGASAGSTSSTSSTTTSGGTTSSPSTIQAAALATLGGNTALQDTGTQNSPIIGAGQTGGTLAPPGTIFPLEQSAMAYSSVTAGAAPADATNSGGATLTYLGTVTVNATTGAPSSTGITLPNYELKIPSLGIDAMVPLATVDYAITSNGYVITTSAQYLNYMFAGNWGASNTAATSYQGEFVTGFQTPASAVPTTGQAVYSSSPYTSNVQGSVYVNANGSFQTGTIGGSATVTVNFASGAVSGSITNTAVKIPTMEGLTWNNVGLTGTLSGATVTGTTAVTSVPSSGGPATFDVSSTGTFAGALFGPSGQELGVVWSLHDSVGGKTAVGVIAAQKSS